MLPAGELPPFTPLLLLTLLALKGGREAAAAAAAVKEERAAGVSSLAGLSEVLEGAAGAESVLGTRVGAGFLVAREVAEGGVPLAVGRRRAATLSAAVSKGLGSGLEGMAGSARAASAVVLVVVDEDAVSVGVKEVSAERGGGVVETGGDAPASLAPEDAGSCAAWDVGWIGF